VYGFVRFVLGHLRAEHRRVAVGVEEGRAPQRGEARSFEKGAAPAKRREPESEDEVASRVETLKIFALGGVALLMVPIFFLSIADPMAPPSPELAARLAAELS